MLMVKTTLPTLLEDEGLTLDMRLMDYYIAL
jgi:hypothetical protein